MNESPSAKTRPKRRSSLLFWFTIINGAWTALLVLSCFICLRLDQHAEMQPDGTVLWREYAIYQAHVEAVDTLLATSIVPQTRPIVEWTGGAKLAQFSPPRRTRATLRQSGHPLVLVPPLLLLLTVPLWLKRLVAWWRVRKANCCRKCGYPTAGLAVGVCPECGSQCSEPRASPAANA